MSKPATEAKDAKFRNATCPADKARVRVPDAGGLYLEVTPSGSKRWFYKYRLAGKEKRLALGTYGTTAGKVSLSKAREARDEAKALLKTGADPVQVRQISTATKAAQSAITFEAVAREFHQAKAPGWSASHAKQWLRCVEKDLFPWIGALPVSEISAPVLLTALRRIEARGATQLVRDVTQYAGQVFTHAILSGTAKYNPAAGMSAAFKSHTVRHAPAVLTPAKVGELMRAINGYTGQPTTRGALLLSALLFQRPGNVRALQWAWIDFDAAMLAIPSADMKRRKKEKLNGRPHFVPLSAQALAVLRDLKPLTGAGVYVFPNLRSGKTPMSDNTINAALRGLGYGADEMTAHGFRAMARTMLVEHVPGVDPNVIEAQLAHAKGGALGEAYDRAEFMALRRQLMQTWADYLDQLRAGAKVIPLSAA